MNTHEQISRWQSLIAELIKLPQETEWAEFKHNNADPVMIGENISALSNVSALLGKKQAYMVWGVDDKTHEVLGASFLPSQTKHKQQELESWLLQKLSPKINFSFYEFEYKEKAVVILEIQPATNSRVIKQATEAGVIKAYDPNAGTTAMRYIPFWA
ncbi:ATP-binding protein [Mannheimia sp. E30BD]|uniref:ATP-binding protein n=1 Tax=Mannheimia sp. E30BD TaxID=3278708 RepID=UPI00359D059E